MANKVQVAFRMDPKVLAQVKELARRADMTQTEVIERAVKLAVETWKDRIVIEMRKKVAK